MTGKLDEAVQIFTEVITTNPSNKKFNKTLYELRGEANLHLRYYLAAFTDFSEALKIGEKTARCFYMRACCHHAMGQFEDCLIDCEASLKIQWTQHVQTLFEDVINLMDSDQKCPYKILGVSKNASIEEIKTAYQNLTLKCHPKQNQNATEEERMKLEWKFEGIAKAYVKLTQSPPPKAAVKPVPILKPSQQPKKIPFNTPTAKPLQPQRQEQTSQQLAQKIDNMKFSVKPIKKPKDSKEDKRRKSNDECSIM